MSRNTNALLPTMWLASLVAALALPLVFVADAGDSLTRWSVRVALAWWLAALLLMLRGREAGRSARWCWSLAAVAFVIHVALAFHFKHGWSHAHAVAHTQDRSGFGAGIYVSHLFTLVWVADAAYWWLAPRSRERRPPWIDAALHGFMLFIGFNGTVVYETGPVRWAALLGFSVLAVAALSRATPVWRRTAVPPPTARTAAKTAVESGP